MNTSANPHNWLKLTRLIIAALMLAAILVAGVSALYSCYLQPEPSGFWARLWERFCPNNANLAAAERAKSMWTVARTSVGITVVLGIAMVGSIAAGSGSPRRQANRPTKVPLNAGRGGSVIDVTVGPALTATEMGINGNTHKRPTLLLTWPHDHDRLASSHTNAQAPENPLIATPPESLRPIDLIIDGTNVCGSYQLDNQFHLESLLNLATELLGRGENFECYFDASTKYQSVERGSKRQRAAYVNLLYRHPVLFREVPAGESADDIVLMRANSESCAVISNDRFKKLEDGHFAKYPWLAVKGRLITGRQYIHRLVVQTLGIDVLVPLDLDESIKAFETAVASSRYGSTAGLQKAA